MTRSSLNYRAYRRRRALLGVLRGLVLVGFIALFGWALAGFAYLAVQP